MPSYKLRTLLILLAVLPPLLGVAWVKYSAWRAEQERERAAQEVAAEQLRQCVAALAMARAQLRAKMAQDRLDGRPLPEDITIFRAVHEANRALEKRSERYKKRIEPRKSAGDMSPLRLAGRFRARRE